MTDFDAAASATHIESLAKNALHEKHGDNTAEKSLLEFVTDLQKDPVKLQSVRSALESDLIVANGLPAVALIDGAGGGLSLSIAAAWLDDKSTYQFEKIDVDAKLAAKTTTPNGTRLYSGNFSRIDLLALQ